MNTCPSITIEFIDHQDQRYPTPGDWFWGDDKKVLHIRVSKMGDWRSEFIVSMHEVFEALACKDAGINEEEVTKFDLNFEEERNRGMHGKQDEPGSDVRAPYLVQHEQATILEAMACEFLRLRWIQHEQNVNSLIQ